MKKILILSLMLPLLWACGGNEPEKPADEHVTLTMNPDVLKLKVSEMGIIRVSGNTAALTWYSTNDSVAKVTSGAVQANAIGDAFIYAKQGQDSVACHVYVTGADGASLRISPAVIALDKGQTYQMRYGNTYNLPMTWSSSAPEIVSVDDAGLVTAIKAGVAFITLSTGGETVSATVAVRHTWSEYELVWSDEFDGSTLDESSWTIQRGIGNGGWGNQEKQYYTDRAENLRVEDGNLIIEARKEDYDKSEYTSARIMSKDKRTFTYGKMEARINLPSGGGLWPAFWMLGNSGAWPSCGEIDIMEYVGNAPNRILGTLHTNKDRDGAHSSRAYTGCNTIENNYHIYGVEWTQEERDGRDIIRFYVDDEVYSEQVEAQIDNHDYWPFNRPHFFIINLAVGGTLGGNINDAIWTEPRLMKVDWVRVYQRHEIE